ncbi:unnamed protein product (macronuclear) [Paramecium tetraurelia]|uniref:Transmembrane protein n=1 Tax=Paramecium tetraurelia TaxID=5888 RepID=A0CP86_PARTE|nr:uncharacterized protein GSPATT00008994001 [Paramecium tetraurelia]CAK72603.1 unnamed protein product [Paramecium tetraurelia]|eukprot:XP_001440000.1 hypothetical protein (macronuclear) [Paramecium tetraurelia strain d4-2]
MNKFTLRFNQQLLEVQYQSTRLVMRKQILYGVSSGFIIMNTISAILKIIGNDNNSLPLDLTQSLVALITVCAVKYYPKYILEGSNILNLLFCLVQINLDEGATSHQMYIFGANIMATQLMLLFGSDFLYSIPQILIMACFRLGIQKVYQQFDWFSISLTLLVSLWLGIVQYQFDKTLRSQFLLTLKDHGWDQLLPQIVDKPYFYFRYNNSQFEIKQIHKQSQIFNYNEDFCQGCNLRHFLREFQFNNQSIETFILNRLKSYQKNIYDREIIGKNKKQYSMQMNYCEIFSDYPNFLIILNDTKNNHNIPKESQASLMKKYFTSYSNHLFKLILKGDSKFKIIQLNYHYLSALFLKDYTVQTFSPYNQLQKIINLSGGVKLQCLKKLTIQGYKNLFSVFWLQTILIMVISQNRSQLELPMIVLNQEQDYIEYTFVLNYPKLFEDMFNQNLVIQRLKQVIFFSINQNKWKFKSYSKLDVAFRKIENN